MLGPPDAAGVRRDLAASLQRWEEQTPRRPPERRDPEDVLTRGDGTVVPIVGSEPVDEIDPTLRGQLEALGYLEEQRSSRAP